MKTRIKRRSIFLLLGLFLLFSFQNCAKYGLKVSDGATQLSSTSAAVSTPVDNTPVATNPPQITPPTTSPPVITPPTTTPPVITVPNRQITQNKEITAENKVDILVVVDNSGSMRDIQANMASRVSSLMNQVKDLDYRIAVTTTDPVDQTTGDGHLLALTGFPNQYVITPAMGLANAQQALANTVQRPETGSGSEQGIYATYRVIERAIAGEVNPKSFFRSDAAFSVILISDANESGITLKNKPQELINLVKLNWPNKKFIFNSLIVRPNDATCLNSGREAYGPTYDELSRLLGYGTTAGSIIGTVCAVDYGSQLSGIGQSVQQLVKVMDLDCSPIGNSTTSVSVVKDGVNYTDTYEIQGLKIVFQNNLPAGKYTLSYQCL